MDFFSKFVLWDDLVGLVTLKNIKYTLKCGIVVQVGINIQVGISLQKNKRTGRIKRTGGWDPFPFLKTLISTYHFSYKINDFLDDQHSNIH